jgi:hypothetical protein
VRRKALVRFFCLMKDTAAAAGVKMQDSGVVIPITVSSAAMVDRRLRVVFETKRNGYPLSRSQVMVSRAPGRRTPPSNITPSISIRNASGFPFMEDLPGTDCTRDLIHVFPDTGPFRECSLQENHCFARRSPGITFTVHAPAIYRANLKREISVHGVRFRLFFGRPGVEIPDRRLA